MMPTGQAARLLTAAVFLFLTACSDSSGPSYEWQLPYDFPEPRVPEENPVTPDKVELGRHLFYDRSLSANSTQACATCHQHRYAFAEPLERAVGSTGESAPRNALALINVAYNSTLTWAHPELLTIEQQMLIPMFGETPVELGISGHEATILQRFRSHPIYKELFARAFPGERDPVSFDNIVKAIASFVRTLISLDSPFDRYAYGGDDSALGESQLRGLELFLSERLECHHCHGGFNFTQSTTHESTSFLERPFHNTGLYNLDRNGSYPSTDQGLIEITGIEEDMGRFRAPTLRNISLTAPYMHDGSIATLEEVIDFYAAGGRRIEDAETAGDGRANPHKSVFVKGFALSSQEREDLLAFLQSLSDEGFINNPAYTDPWQ